MSQPVTHLSGARTERETATRLAAFCCRAFGLKHAFVYLEDGRSEPILAGYGAELSPNPEVLAFLHEAALNEDPLIYEDASIAPISAPHPIRFLTSIPLAADDGEFIGSLIVFKTKPHKVSESDIHTLQAFAGLATELIEARRSRQLVAEVASDKSKVELALAESQARYLRIADNLPGMLFQFEMNQDGTMQFPFVGVGSMHLLGKCPMELLGDAFAFMEMIHEDDVEGFRRSLFESVVTGEVWEFEARIIRSDASVRWIHGVSRPEFRLNGAIMWDGILLDTTEHKRTQSALAASEERFRQTFENALDGIVSVDSAGTICGWNTQASRIFGYASGEAIGKSFGALFNLSDAQAQLLVDSIKLDVVDGLVGKRIESIGVRRNTQRFPIEVATTVVGEGADRALVAFLRDITDRRRAEEDLYLAKEEAERANRSKSDFLSRMSHELRTPLNAILGFAQLLQMEELSEDAEDAVTHVLNAGAHLLGLINEVLDIARIESGRISLNMEEVDASTLVLEVVSFLQPLADQTAVELSCIGYETEVVAYTDPQRLRQVLMNLLSNGIKYTREHGHVWVRIEQLADLLRIDVEDDGPGISPEGIDRLFTPFDRLGADSTKVEGTGLGLPVAKILVEAMGGAISVRSIVGKGSTFSLVLPAKLEGEESMSAPGQDQSFELPESA